MERVALAREAMATRFEAVLFGDQPVALRAAAEEALDEIERLEQKLSIYRAESEISRLNARGAFEPVRLDPEVFALLARAGDLSRATGGAFDITVAPLMACWGFVGAGGNFPDGDALAAARERVGIQHLQFFPEEHAVQFDREGVRVDLGAIGKGYAIERGAELLVEAGIASALLHGGTSSVHGIGSPPGERAWKVGVPKPSATSLSLEASSEFAAVVELKDCSLSVSANWGKYFVHEGKIYGHVLDPRTGWPAHRSVLAAAVLPFAAESDALSTALLISGAEGQSRLHEIRPEMRSLVISRDPEATDEWEIASEGIELLK